jgi:hypothetical protein
MPLAADEAALNQIKTAKLWVEKNGKIQEVGLLG